MGRPWGDPGYTCRHDGLSARFPTVSLCLPRGFPWLRRCDICKQFSRTRSRVGLRPDLQTGYVRSDTQMLQRWIRRGSRLQRAERTDRLIPLSKVRPGSGGGMHRSDSRVRVNMHGDAARL